MENFKNTKTNLQYSEEEKIAMHSYLLHRDELFKTVCEDESSIDTALLMYILTAEKRLKVMQEVFGLFKETKIIEKEHKK